MKLKTSIELFIEQLEEHLLAHHDTVLHLKNTEAFVLAMEMHKQEIISAYNKGDSDCEKIFIAKGKDYEYESGLDYYNKKYNNN